jgi:DnaJ-class molecular chaperone
MGWLKDFEYWWAERISKLKQLDVPEEIAKTTTIETVKAAWREAYNKYELCPVCKDMEPECSFCNSTGVRPRLEPCSICEGKGRLYFETGHGASAGTTSEVCRSCNGAGAML